MPLILVVEQEQRYVERIVEALSPQGWDVVGVEDTDTALKHRADETASLLIVNGEVAAAADLVEVFCREGGGPGAVVLVPEDADDGVHRLGADEILQKPFTDQEIRLAVRRCLVGLSNPSTQQVTTDPTPPTESAPERLTSEDLFGDMVTELESTFKFSVEEDAEEDDAVGVAEEAPQPVAEADVEEAPVEVVEAAESAIVDEPEAPQPEVGAEPVDERAAAEAREEAVGEPAREAGAVAESAEIEEIEKAEVAGSAEPDVPVEETVEEAQEVAESVDDLDEDLREAPPQPPERPVEAAETAKRVEPEKAEKPPEPRRDPAAVLEERIRQAAEEGKRLASTKRRARRRDDDLGRSTETLLQKALADIDEETPRQRRRAARSTEEEVDDLVGAVVDDGEGEPAPTAETIMGESEFEDADGGDDSESPALEVYERDERELEESEYQTRLKMIWVIILIVALGILAFVLVSGWRDDAATGEPPAAPAERQEIEAEPEAEAGEPGTATEEDSEGEEGTLEQELESQRRQLQEEIARSRAAQEDGP